MMKRPKKEDVAVRILLTRVANEGVLPFAFTTAPAVHDTWFRAKVQEALDDPRQAIPHDEVEAHFAKRRTVAFRKAGEGDACGIFDYIEEDSPRAAVVVELAGIEPNGLRCASIRVRTHAPPWLP